MLGSGGGVALGGAARAGEGIISRSSLIVLLESVGAVDDRKTRRGYRLVVGRLALGGVVGALGDVLGAHPPLTAAGMSSTAVPSSSKFSDGSGIRQRQGVSAAAVWPAGWR